MASAVSILIAARAATAAAFARARADAAAMGRAVASTSRSMLQHTRTVQIMAGAYRDADGRWRDAHGRFVRADQVFRTTTTTLGRLVDVMEGLTTSAIRSAPAIGALGAKAAGLLAVLLPLVGAVGNLVPLIMLAAPAAASAGLAMLTFKLALNGVGEALKAGLTGDTEAFEKALKKLEPAAADAVRTLVQLRDAWKPLQQRVQGEIFAGFAGELRGLDKFIRPVAERQLPKLATSIAAIRSQLADGLANYAADGRLEKVWASLNEAVSKLLVALVPLGRAFGDILEVAAPRFAKLAGYILDAAEAFGDWIREARDSGKLGEWLDKAMTTFGKLKDIASNVGEIIAGIFRASSDEGDDMLDQMVSATQSISDWVNGDGQGVINFFSNVFQLLGQVAPLFDLWSKYFAGISVAAGAAWDFISEALRFAVNLWVSYLGAMVTAAAKAFGWIPGIGPKLKQAAAEFEEYKNRVNRSLDGIQDEVVNITYHVREVRSGAVTHAKGGGLQFNAHGGNAANTRIVGETDGPEIVDFTRGMVYNSNQTKRMKAGLAKMAAGGGGGGVVLSLDSVRASSLGAAVAALFGAALESRQLWLQVDGGGNVVLAGR